MADDEVTDRLFPPPERPIPLRPSLREEFAAHHTAIIGELQTWRVELAAGLARLTPPEPAQPPATPSGALQKAKAGALASLRYGGVALALGEAAAQLAAVTGHPEIEGPIRVIINLFGGQ